MGTEQQQEFKSEKPLSKPQRKTIPFTDKAIENWKPKKPREQRAFPRTNTTNGIKILKAFPHLKKKDVMVPTDGQNGPDIILSRIAKKLCPYNWELKNQQKMAKVYKWHKQASKNTRLTPVVVCKMNTRDPIGNPGPGSLYVPY